MLFVIRECCRQCQKGIHAFHGRRSNASNERVPKYGARLHVGDLQAARRYGLRTCFIYRPNEYGGGPAGVPDRAKSGDFDVVSVSIVDLAQQLGA